jgi:hypothetical protein
MNRDFGDLVHDSMTWFTDGADAPAGLAARVRRQHRRRQQAKLGWFAAGTALASATAVIAATGAASPSRISHHHVSTAHAINAQTAARVISAVERAMAQTSATNPIENTRETVSGIRLAVAIPSRQPVFVSASVISTWSRGRFERSEFFAPNGQVQLSTASTTSSGMSHQVWVSYPEKVWWSGTYQAASAGVPKPICALDATRRTPAAWASEVRKLLSCGAAAVEGHARIDGVAAIKLGLNNRYAQGCAGTSDHRRCGGSANWTGTLWVSASSHLPIRLTGGGSSYRFQTDFRWLPATPASLAMLHQTIPSGFRHV